MCHLHSEHNILATVSPNYMILEIMETRDPDLSDDVQVEKIQASKNLQTTAQKYDQNRVKPRKEE